MNWHLLFVSGLGQCYDTTFAIYMVLGPADVPLEEEPDDQLVDQVGLLPLGQQKWDSYQQMQRRSWTSSSSQRWSVLRLQYFAAVKLQFLQF